MDNGITFLPNDRYLLENEKFRLYYTAQGDEAHNFIVVVEDKDVYKRQTWYTLPRPPRI